MKSLNPLSTSEAKSLYTEAKNAYYNKGNSALTDAEFDKLEDRLAEAAPKWLAAQKTGSPVKLGKKVEVALFVPCPSLEKLTSAKPEKLDAWLDKTAAKYGRLFRVSHKLDGSSVQSVYKAGKLVQLATRGDGVTGKDITFLAQHLNIPQSIVTDSATVIVRHEAIMPVGAYEKNWSGQYDTARALASAVLNRQDACPALRDLHLVAIELQHPMAGRTEGLKTLAKMGFKTAVGEVFKRQNITSEGLAQFLERARAGSKYELDGLVLVSETDGVEHSSEKPGHARAFKVNDEAGAVETTIVDIKWQPSSFGVLVPKAIIAPINIGGATIKQAAIYNARWALDRGVGVGAVVRVLRSGDIIPKIVEVVKAKKFALPNVADFGDWEWDDSGTSLRLTSADENADVRVARLNRMFSKLGLEQMGGGLSRKLIEAGYTTTEQVIVLGEEEFAALPGVKSMAAKYADQLAAVRSGKDIVTLMQASGCFDRGLGGTRLQTLRAADSGALEIGSIRLNTKALASTLERSVAAVSGCGPAFAKLYVAGLPAFIKWLKATGCVVKTTKAKALPVGKLTGKVFSWTGYRSAAEVEAVNKLGGVEAPFGRKTNVLFVSPTGKASGKADKAEAMGIQISTFADYMKGVR